MVATKKSKTQPALKQSTLSFASKRAYSSKVNEKKPTPIRKTGSAPAKAEPASTKRLRSPSPLEVSSESEDETETERSSLKSVKGTKIQETTVPTLPVAEEIEREHLNPKDRKWNKHYANVKEMMGGLPAGEQPGLRTPYLTEISCGTNSPWGETDQDTRDLESV